MSLSTLSRLRVFILCFLLLAPSLDQAQEPSPLSSEYETQTAWPGVRFRIVHIKRLSEKHLMIVVRILGGKETPPGGVFLGTKVPIPPTATYDEIASGRFKPISFSLNGSTMTEEKSGISYPVLPNIASAIPSYFNSVTLATIYPNQTVSLSIQFAIPPQIPLPTSGEPPPKQTLSFFLPKAKGPISHVPLPGPSSGASDQNH